MQLVFLWIVLLCHPGSQLQTRPTDLDSKGHVNNARYIEFLQAGRWEWLAAKGLTEERLKALGVTFVVARVEIDYKAECGYPEILTIHTEVLRIGSKSLTIHQRIMKASGAVAAAGSVVLVAVDPQTHRSRALPAELVQVLSQ